jgi:hypothetical protein
MSNRVEELEAKVSELQAAVNGLTEELVETKERLREIETAQEVEPRASVTGNQADSETADSASAEEAAESESAHSEILEPAHGGTMGAGPESNDAESSADADDTETTTGSADGDADDIKSEGDDEADDGESDESDIIVA